MIVDIEGKGRLEFPDGTDPKTIDMVVKRDFFSEKQPEGQSILSKIGSALAEPGRVFKEEVTQGFNTLKDLVTQERPKPTREELMSPDISVDIEGGMNRARQGLGALAKIAFAPGTAFTKPILGQPTYKGLKALGVPEEWAKGTSEAVETLPYFLMGGQMIKAPKGLEISKRYGITPEQMQNILKEAEIGGVPKADYLALPPGQGFKLVGKPTVPTEKGAPFYTKNIMPENIPVPEQKLLPPGQGKIPYRETAPTILKGKELPQDIAFIEEKLKGALETKPFARTAEQKALLRTTFGDELYTLGGGKKFKEEIKKVLPTIKELLKPTTPERAQEALLKKVGTPTPITQPIPESVANIMDALTTVERLTPKQKALYTAERGKRIQEAVRAGESGGESGYYAKLGKLKGELPKVEFETLRGKITQQNVDDLFNQINIHPTLNDFDRLTAQRGLTKILGKEGGYLPNPGEIAKLREVFPKEFIDTLMKHRPLTSKLFEGTMEALSLPKAIMASFDLSAPLRQGIFLIGRPKQFIPAFKEMFKYAFKEEAYQGSLAQIKSRPTYPLMQNIITELNAPLWKREEVFMSQLAEKIPILGRPIRASNRAYSGFLNKLRADVFDDIYKKAVDMGHLERNPDIARDLSKFIGTATGRGPLGELEKSLVVLNASLFSPRLMASRVDLMTKVFRPSFYTKLDPLVRKEYLKSLATFGGLVGSILGLAKLGGVKVGTDYRSADFGKIKIGNTRYDLWGGFQQYMVLASRFVSGEMVMSTTGREYELGEGYRPTTRKDIIIRFIENKLSPVASFVTKLLSSEKNINKEFRTSKEIIDRFIPMLASDIYDLYYEKGAKGIPMAIPGAFGVGIQTYGEQIPREGRTKSGRPRREWLNTPTFGENLANLLSGKELTNIPQNQWENLREKRKAKIEYDIQKEQRLSERMRE